jgi:hypothetical protein
MATFCGLMSGLAKGGGRRTAEVAWALVNARWQMPKLSSFGYPHPV